MKRFFHLFIIIVLASSCVTQRDVIYLQDQKSGDLANTKMQPYYLKTNDVLSVRVLHQDPTLSNQFNTMMVGLAGGGGNFNNADPGNLFLQGYTIDDNGDITMPNIGKVQVRKLTVDQAQEMIQRRLDEYLKNATVLVRMVSFRVTVLGEVRNPGQFYIFNRQATIFDGLGMAGDILAFGNRQEVKVIRQRQEGSEIVKLDLRDPKLLESPYYYLAPNDAIYVEPLGAQTIRNNFIIVGTVSSALTAVILLYNFIERLSN